MRAVDELQALDAVAVEKGVVLAFRACQESDEYEPVFLNLARSDVGSGDEAAMIAITDANGMSLGSYVVSRRRLDAALDRSEEIVS